MKKEKETKIMTCLYIIIALLFVNTVCSFISLSQNESKKIESNSPSTSEYDVSMFEKSTPTEITKKIKNGDLFVLYFGSSECAYCRKMLPTLQEAQKNYNYKTVYLDIKTVNVNSAEYKEMTALLDVIMTANNETKKFGEFEVTPMIAILNKGKMVDGMIGYNTYDNFVEFLENNGIEKK